MTDIHHPDAPSVGEVEAGVEGGPRFYYRASSLGRCIKASVAERMGYEPMAWPDDFLRRFKDGHLHEPAIFEELRSRDTWRDIETVDPVTQKQFAVFVKVSESTFIVGHMDGRGVKKGTPRIIEAKALANDGALKFEREGLKAFPHYEVQLSTYMHGSGLPATFVVKNKNTGLVVERDIDEPPIPLNQLKQRVVKSEAFARQGQMPDCDQNDYPCLFAYLHDKPVDESVFDASLNSLGEMWKRGKDLEAQGKAIADDARERIEKALDGRPKVRTGRFTMSRYEQTRTSPDAKALQERFPEVWEQVARETKFWVVKITDREAKGK